MLLIPGHGEKLETLANTIRLADAPSCSVMDAVVAECTRLTTLKLAGRTGSFDMWCESGAWVDAARTLLALALPGWSIRRLVCNDGFWFCTLSHSPNLPIEIDDVVEASHEDMALAILSAIVEVKRCGTASAPAVRTTPQATSSAVHRICCDNFA